MTRGYGQYCGLARALDLVGGRWTMMIVRELLTGPKRFTDLEQGLPGIPTNVLSARLRELEDSGLVERRLRPRPASAVVYGLTDYGLELEDAIVRLGMWGAKSLGEPKEGEFFSLASLAIALRGAFDVEAAKDHDLLVELRVAGQRLYVCVSGGQVSFPSEPSLGPHLVLEAAPDVLSELLSGPESIDAAIAAGRLRVDGPHREARRFFAIFHLLARVGSPR
jgi:DNA-binding HxlR family transcriptional regulator/putative sterol carrier protein